MKKLIAIILIIALAVPALAMAESPLSIIGCWAHYELQTSGAPQMTMLYLAEDHTCYYMIRSFQPGEEGNGRVYAGTWEMDENCTVTAKTGENSTTVLRFSDGYFVAQNQKNGAYLLNLDIFQLNP